MVNEKDLQKSFIKGELTEKQFNKAVKELRKEKQANLKQEQEEKERQTKLKQMNFEQTEPELTSMSEAESYKDKFKKKFLKRKHKKTPHKLVVCHIELLNGYRRTLIAKETNGGFKYLEKFYIFDNLSKTYNIDTELFEYNFHEQYSVPVKKEISIKKGGEKQLQKIDIILPIDSTIPVNQIKELIDTSDIYDIENASNPSNLNKFLESNVIEMLIKGVEMDKVFRFLKLLMMIMVVVGIITLLVVLYNSGVFEGLKG